MPSTAAPQALAMMSADGCLSHYRTGTLCVCVCLCVSCSLLLSLGVCLMQRNPVIGSVTSLSQWYKSPSVLVQDGGRTKAAAARVCCVVFCLLQPPHCHISRSRKTIENTAIFNLTLLSPPSTRLQCTVCQHSHLHHHGQPKRWFYFQHSH